MLHCKKSTAVTDVWNDGSPEKPLTAPVPTSLIQQRLIGFWGFGRDEQ
jgi:hypothetical protein